MPIQIPFPYLASLPPEDREKLRRNFEAIGQQLGVSPTQFDAIVDPSIAADNTNTRTFKTVFAAVKYLADSLGIVSQVIGLQRGTTTETVNYSGTTANLTVRLIAIGNNEALPAAVTPVTWSTATFVDGSGKMRNVIITGISVSSLLASS